jgi:hypothetical protein
MPQIPQARAITSGKRIGAGAKADAPGRMVLGTFVLMMAIAALSAAATLPLSWLGDDFLVLSVLLVLAGWIGSRTIHIQRFRIEITAGDAFMFCGLVVCGPMAACLIACTGVLGAIAFGSKKPKFIRALFNVASMVLASAVAGHFHLLLLELLSPGLVDASLALLTAAAAFALVNTATVAVAIRLERGKALADVWMGFAPMTFNSTIASLLIGLGLNSLVTAVGAIGLVLGFAGTAVIRASAQAFRDRLEGLSARAPQTGIGL